MKYNNSEVEPSTFKQPTPGLYTMSILEANLRQEEGHNDIEVILEVQGGEFDKARLWTYVGLSEASAWKFREFTDAVGMPPEGELDTNTLIGKRMKVKVNGDQWQGEYRARAGRFAPVDAAAAKESANGATAAPASEEAPKAAAGKTTRGRRGKAAPVPVPEPEPEPEEPAEEYGTWSVEDLQAAIDEDKNLKEKYPEEFWDDQEFLADFLTAADEGEDALDELLSEVEAEDEPEGEEEGAQPDYSEMSLDELKEEVQRRGLTLPKGRVPKPRLVKMLEADDGDGSDPFKS